MTLDLEAIRKRAEAANMQSVRDAVEAFGKAARKFGASLEKGGDQFIATFDAELVGAKAKLLAEIARLGGERDEAPSWRCFHCDEVFATVESAREHFGSDCLCTPGCCIDITEYRRMEAVHQSHLDETDAGSRHYFALQALHREALKREEEKGYARGIDDMRAELTAAESALEHVADFWEPHWRGHRESIPSIAEWLITEIKGYVEKRDAENDAAESALAACREENERLREGLKQTGDLASVAHDMLHTLVHLCDVIKIRSPKVAESLRIEIDKLADRYGTANFGRARALIEGGGNGE